jgi:hypothetical protein
VRVWGEQRRPSAMDDDDNPNDDNPNDDNDRGDVRTA